ncbi:hypothetical protein [Labrenzia sp. VG12]|uniref:hypothetical protein n=1 Tax=Labrenzia sp. VG12 TaxID=2021862 RepID=UPI0012FDAA31|nr:hypothetical protein [Labrenzia sp. VG12]
MTKFRYTVTLDAATGELVEGLARHAEIPTARLIKNMFMLSHADLHFFNVWLSQQKEGTDQYLRGRHSLTNPGPHRLIADAAAIERDNGNKLLVGADALKRDPECGGVCVVSADLANPGSGAS